MAIVILKDIVISYGERDLFDEISADFQEDQKIGIVGRNGAGKSTLLKVIAGQLELDRGSIVREKQKRIAYLPQEVVLHSDRTVFEEAFLVFEEYTKLEAEQVQIEAQLAHEHADTDRLLDRYQHVLDTLQHFDRGNAERRTIEVLQGLGFSKDRFDKIVDTLSVGWKMRLVLGKLLLQNADFYLFDEPTNHLDIVTKEWFIEFLRNASFGYLLVTHDRHFLDKACDWIFEISRGKAVSHRGNYSSYLALYEKRKDEAATAFALQQREIARKKSTIERFKASASKAKMAQSMMKQLDKIEVLTVEPPEPTFTLSFPPVQRAGKTVLRVKDLSYAYGPKQLFKDATCEVMRGQKVAIVAPNGVGKSTLFDLMAGKLELQTGEVEFGHNAKFALFEQDQTKALDQNRTILQELLATCSNKSEQMIRSFLGSFLFRGDDVNKKIHMLSGGERNRVAMVKVFLQDANVLLLDEPTNHLDLQAKAVLLQALKKYPGTILFVSHDHQFIQELATDILELTPTGLHPFPGTFEEFLIFKKEQEVEKQVQQAAPVVEVKQEKVRSKDEQKALRMLERDIKKIESKIANKEKELGMQEYGSELHVKFSNVLDKLRGELKAAMEEWEKLSV